MKLTKIANLGGCVLIATMMSSTAFAQKKDKAPVDDGLGPYFDVGISGPSAKLTIVDGETVWGVKPGGLNATVGYLHSRVLNSGLSGNLAPSYWSNKDWGLAVGSRLFSAFTPKTDDGALGFLLSPGVSFFKYFGGPVDGAYIAPSVQAGVGLTPGSNLGFSANLEVGYQFALGEGRNGPYVVPSLGLGISL